MLTNVEPIEPDAVYTVAEAARVTRLGENTLRKLARNGALDAIRVGKRVLRFKGSALLAFLNAGGTGAPVNAIPDQVRRRAPRIAS